MSPRLVVFKFASCDGCQLSLLDCEDELLAVAGAVEIAYFLEATRRPLEGNFDLALVEGSISAPEQLEQVQEVVGAFLAGRRPNVPNHAVCVECKRAGVVCVMVAQGTPCLGPITHAGCGALCPSYNRGCFGCYGPAKLPNLASL